MESYHIVYKRQLIAEPVSLGNKCRLKNFYRIGKDVYRSDQPSANCFRELEKFGIREVLNLRCYHNDIKEARGTNILLHHLRTRATLLSLDDLIAAMRIILNRRGPILFHCWHGSDRTGAVAAMYRMIFQNIPKQQALDEMVEGIYGFHMIFDNIIDTIETANITQIREQLFQGKESTTKTTDEYF